MNKLSPKDLQELVADGIIPEETAERIISYYQQKKQSAPNSFVIILGILGALLTGSGILLIVAHNWDDLSVPVKTILAFLPLLLAQAACAYTLLKRRRDRAWVECSSLFLFFAIGASISFNKPDIPGERITARVPASLGIVSPAINLPVISKYGRFIMYRCNYMVCLRAGVF